MLAKFYNEAVFELVLKPRTPLLIKAGGEGAAAIDPTVPDMNFVRTHRNGRDEVYIPGSSLRGVIRSYAEKLIRSVNKSEACDPTDTQGKGRLRQACGTNEREIERKTGKKKLTDLTGPEAFSISCYACRLFGNTTLAGRVRVCDFYLEGNPRLETRYGVAIDRVTGAVAQGPFEIETLTEGAFSGTIAIRNFTLGQFGLLGAALLDISDGLVPIGFSKSRGLGRVEFTFRRLAIRTLKDPEGHLQGVGFWADEKDREDYKLPAPEEDQMPWEMPVQRVRGFYEAALEDHDRIKGLLEEVTARWPEEVLR
jgi:CRISPR/Cas system CSM-associated protein Csm3 (group 7 of RAMP superfamily)